MKVHVWICVTNKVSNNETASNLLLWSFMGREASGCFSKLFISDKIMSVMGPWLRCGDNNRGRRGGAHRGPSLTHASLRVPRGKELNKSPDTSIVITLWRRYTAPARRHWAGDAGWPTCQLLSCANNNNNNNCACETDTPWLTRRERGMRADPC